MCKWLWQRSRLRESLLLRQELHRWKRLWMPLVLFIYLLNGIMDLFLFSHLHDNVALGSHFQFNLVSFHSSLSVRFSVLSLRLPLLFFVTPLSFFFLYFWIPWTSQSWTKWWSDKEGDIYIYTIEENFRFWKNIRGKRRMVISIYLCFPPGIKGPGAVTTRCKYRHISIEKKTKNSSRVPRISYLPYTYIQLAYYKQHESPLYLPIFIFSSFLSYPHPR